MSGVFAEWQPRYAEHGVATFPVENKIPRVRSWQKLGLNGSSQLAMKFPDADAFGFQCGARNRITLIDIDSDDVNVVARPSSWSVNRRSCGARGAATMPCRFATMERLAAFARWPGCRSTCSVRLCRGSAKHGVEATV